MAYVTIEKGIITATAQNSLTDLNDLIRELTALQGKLPLVEARAIIATLNPQSEFRVIEDAILRIVTLSTAMEVPDLALMVSGLMDALKWPLPATNYAIAKAQIQLGHE